LRFYGISRGIKYWFKNGQVSRNKTNSKTYVISEKPTANKKSALDNLVR
jgi:hypothetical protein